MKFTLMTGCAGFPGGVLSGAVMGLLFHRDSYHGCIALVSKRANDSVVGPSIQDLRIQLL